MLARGPGDVERGGKGCSDGEEREWAGCRNSDS